MQTQKICCGADNGKDGANLLTSQVKREKNLFINSGGERSLASVKIIGALDFLMDDQHIGCWLRSERVKLVAYIRSIVRDQHLAEDIFQDVSILALKKGQHINDHDHFMAWMRTSARLEALSCLRRHRSQPIALTARTLETLDSQWSRYDEASSATMVHALNHCLGKLGPHARKVLAMRYHDGLNSPQIAQRVNRTLGTIYVTFSRVYRILAECIERRIAVTGEAFADEETHV